jgi:hypothetical protein
MGELKTTVALKLHRRSARTSPGYAAADFGECSQGVTLLSGSVKLGGEAAFTLASSAAGMCLAPRALAHLSLGQRPRRNSVSKNKR